MHECPDCGMACDCDGEDLWNAAASEDCTHSETEDCLRESDDDSDSMDILLDEGGEA